MYGMLHIIDLLPEVIPSTVESGSANNSTKNRFLVLIYCTNGLQDDRFSFKNNWKREWNFYHRNLRLRCIDLYGQ